LPAEGASVSVDVHIVDAITKQPVPLARVVLSGDESLVGYTDQQGHALFSNVPEGKYTVRARRNGYHPQSSDVLDIASDRQTVIEVVLSPLAALTAIGSVKASTRASLQTDGISSGSVLERLNGGSLLGALGGGEFGAKGGLLSVDGHDPTQTSVAIDGVQIGAVGLPTDLRGLNVDLFGGASLSGSSATALGGTLDLTTLEPTVAPQTSTTLSYGSHGQSVVRSWIRGSIGQIGIVASHASAGADGPLNGQTFLDGSGFDYPHRSGTVAHGDLLKLRAPLSSRQSLTATVLSSSTSGDEICERISGPLPCGFGPGNHDSLITDAAILRYQLAGDVFNMSVSGARARSRFDVNLSQRFANGVPDPAENSGTSDSDSLAGSFRLNGLSSTSSFRFSARQTRFHQNLFGGLSAGVTASRSIIDGALSHEIQLRNLARLSASLLYERNFVDKPLGLELSALITPTSRDTIVLKARLQNGGAAPINGGFLMDPASLVYDCQAHAVFGQTIGSAATQSSVSDMSASWTQRSRQGSVSFNIGRQIQRGTSVATILNGADLGLSQSYLSSISQFFATPAACGSPTSLSPSDVYFTTTIGGITQVYETARLGFSQQLGSSLSVGGYVRFADARVVSTDQRFNSPSSVTIPGRQLPNVARFRAGIVGDLKAPRSPLELLGLIQYVGANNPNNLPPYATVALGATYTGKFGSLTLTSTNLIGVYSDRFASPRFAVPLVLAGGGTLPTLAQPLARRSVGITYTMRTGLRRKNSTLSAADIDTAAQQVSVSFGPLPQVPPTKPFELDRADPNCKPENIRDAQAIVDAVSHAVSEIEAVRTSTGAYPETFELSKYKLDGVRLLYRRTASSFAVELQLPTLFGLGISCVPIAAAGEVTTAQERGAFVDTSLPPHALEYDFMPRFGFYVVFHQGVVVKRSTESPLKRPADLLAVRDDCPASTKPLLDEVLGVFRSGEAPPALTTLTSGITITLHEKGASRAYLLSFPDALTFGIFSSCVYTTSMTNAEASSRYGLPVVPQRRLVFTTKDGFIVVSP
jgi:hypothetical protein